MKARMTEPPASPNTAPARSTSQRTGLWLGPLLMGVMLALPLPGLGPAAHTLAGIMTLVVVYWVTEAIPLAATALLGPALCIVLGVAEDRAVFAPFASPITFLFLGSFLLAEAMTKYGLDRRLAFSLLAIPALAKTPTRLFATLALLTAGLSMWMSNTATTAMMLPIALGCLRSWPALHGSRETRAALVLLIAFAASVGGQGTPVGTPPNLIGLGAVRETLGIDVSFVQWMMFGVPLVVTQITFLLLVLRPARITADAGFGVATLPEAPEAAARPWSVGERQTVIVFFLAVVLWMTPGLLSLIFSPANAVTVFLDAHFPEETVGLLAGVSLLVLPQSWRGGPMTLTWREASRIDWGTILLFAGGMALGKQLFETGLAEAIGRGAVSLLGGAPGLWTLVAMGIVLSILVSEAASNTASATVMVPVMIAVAQSAGVDPVPVALATCLACSFGFLLPVSTPPNALAYGTGEVTIPEMIRRGFWLDVAGAISIFLMFRLLWPFMNWGAP